MELVARQRQDCTWFISHAWLTPFKQTLEMLEWHAEVHQLPRGAAYYWFCTLANVSYAALHTLHCSPVHTALARVRLADSHAV